MYIMSPNGGDVCFDIGFIVQVYIILVSVQSISIEKYFYLLYDKKYLETKNFLTWIISRVLTISRHRY